MIRLYLLRARFLLLPVALLFTLFLFDKLFLLPDIRDNFLQPGGSIYYRQRHEQLSTTRADIPKLRALGYKVGAVFGDSRSFSIGNLSAGTAKNMMGFDTDGWHLFNFASPQAVPAYHAYLAEKLFTRLPEERPGYVLIGLSPDAFNRNAFIFSDPVLKFGVDAAWIERNRTHIPRINYEDYESSRRYALVGLNFSLKELFSRTMGEFRKPISLPMGEQLAMMNMIAGMTGGQNQLPESIRESFPNSRGYLGAMAEARKKDLTMYSYLNSPQRELLHLAAGAQYLWFGAASEQDLRAETDLLVSLYFRNFVISEEQFYFFRETLRHARRGGARAIVFWPKVNPYLRAEYEREPAIQAIWRRVEAIARQEGAIALDLNQPGRVPCDAFYDASHMSVSCFPGVTGLLLKELDAPPN
ncbi:MAG: DUF1574 domain-containing protein [bacterium]|nr:DUF1574 domain-containing protein [bacterium]